MRQGSFAWHYQILSIPENGLGRHHQPTSGGLLAENAISLQCNIRIGSPVSKCPHL
jgi:hypothetical protein